ncbi:hypothetical protein V5097_05390 [Arenibacter palladensis]|uniref:hypothetical protein n=1 Tax=Arenibacter palladensis TaxID=237373 RepID=UPI002FCF841D
MYFVCFVASAVLYYTLEPENNNKNNRDSAEIIQLQSDNLDLDHKLAKLERIQE